MIFLTLKMTSDVENDTIESAILNNSYIVSLTLLGLI